MKKQEKKEKRPKSFRAIAVRIIALALCTWLGFNFLLTWNMEKEIFLQVQSRLDEILPQWKYDAEPSYPGELEMNMILSLNEPDIYVKKNHRDPFFLLQEPKTDNDGYWTVSTSLADYNCAMVFYDLEKSTIISNGNYLMFPYAKTADWMAGEMEEKKYAWVNLDAVAGLKEILEPYLFDTEYYKTDYRKLPVIRLTGWFEENQFHPITLDLGGCDNDEIWSAHGAHSLKDDLRRINKSDQQGQLNWKNLLTVPSEPGQELTTIYGWNVYKVLGYEPKPVTVTVDGVEYESLTALLLAMDGGWGVARGFSESIIFTTEYIDADEYGWFCCSLIVSFKPLQEAMLRLQPVYWISGILTVLAVALILGQIWQRLIWPLRDLNKSLAENLDIRPWGQWEEAYALENWCKDNRQALLEAQAEITRLNTALDYARDAEEYRKQLISNITHELKTPLAVVHSYTEGLQSEIAPEKKERYMQVILDEAERMDGMVMQMLELSRLEAGRVKLKMEHFDLGAVIRDVAERFEPLMAEKELKLRLELDGQEQMNGDEGRMEQVITNFMSNAVKYSTPGGEILVKAIFGKLGLYFSITNNAKHLSDEGLNKVFDSFYREDAARTEKSTGLGLAIVKNIMNLHGFQCYVNNTMLNDQPAVEFGFRRE